MKKNILYVLLALISNLCFNIISSAQIVGTQAFLQGRFLEIGLCSNAAFGTGTSPAGYHPHSGGSGTQLAEVYDYGHDGWTVGTPPFMGDYTYYGSPFEGWEIQANGCRSQQYASPAYSFSPYYYSGGCTMTGAGFTGYSNTGGSAIANWAGTFSAGGAQLAIKMDTRIDTNASWVVVNVKLHNTGSAMANNVYYFRSCDPDDDASWPGGSFGTDNWPTYQNDTIHRVLVSATGPSATHPYFGLGTIDSRAVALVYNSWGLTVVQDLAALWSKTYGPADYTQGVHDAGDIGIGLVFNIGNIAPGDSANFTYAYLFKDSLDIDSTMGLTGGDPSILDSFKTIKYNDCSGTHLTVYNNHYIPGLTITTYFGDGTITTTPMPAYYSFGHYVNCATINHPYLNSGVYTIRQVLYNGTTPVDSMVGSCSYAFCNDIHVNFYYDANSDCTRETTEPYIYQPFLTEIDSNGVPVDTVSSLSGLYYRAYGSAGDVYNIKVLSAPAGLYVTCPSTAMVTDTLRAGTYSDKTIQFGTSCTSSTGSDLQVFTSFRAGPHHFGGSIIVDNTMCPVTPAILTMQLSPKYDYQSASPIPSVAGHTFTWNFNLSNIITTPVYISVGCEKPSGGSSYTLGDTANSVYIINPISGDLNPVDNTCIRIDTIKSGYDPNYIDADPSGFITAGTNITYSIGFENTGNDTAHNIYIMDTLSGYLDISSLRMVAASAYMDISKISYGSQTILKFAFPNIMLPDSSHHNQCTGLLIYSINTRAGLAPGTVIPAHAGIYFDDNDVVNTDTAFDVISTPGTLHIANANKNDIQLFPNPTTNELTIKTDQTTYTSYTITNTLGQLMIQQPITSATTKVNVAALPAGLYYISLKGDNGNVVRKFVKM